MDAPSKSQRKRAMHALQELGEELVRLPKERLRELNLGDALHAAIVEAQRITSHEGKRRQLQYVGRLMREVDAEPIAAQLERWKQPGRAEAKMHQQAEQWRAQLLNDAGALDDLCAKFAHAASERARIEEFVRQARWESEQGKPPKAARALFRLLSDVLHAGATTTTSS
jgi:ribosome-associated protein